MKERPILFSGAMVRALLAGTKTQTRRVVKAKHLPWIENSFLNFLDGNWNQRPLPYGRPGDRLWVREAFDFLPAVGPDEPQACEIVYWATGSTEPRCAPESYNPMIYGREKVRPSIHMPRFASRITLEVLSVRVERLQDISEADAMAEGITEFIGGWWSEHAAEDRGIQAGATPQEGYRYLWEQINGPTSWAANPRVWVIEFRRLA